MSLRTWKFAVLAACCILGFAAGCEPWRKHALRPKHDGPAVATDPVTEDPSFKRPGELKGFFKSGKSGTWSSEARDIERSLGVDR